MKQLHFCGGLPRSGSTVLMNILQQNPEVFTTGTCALPDLLNTVLIKSRYKESFQAMSAQQADAAMHGFVTAGVGGWFGGLTNKCVVISKNRSWSNYWHLFPSSKYIAMIRDLRDIAESFDRVNRGIGALHTFNDHGTLLPAMTETERLRYYFRETNPITVALNTEVSRLVEMHASGWPVMFVRYEDFVRNPDRTLCDIYGFLGMPHYEHCLRDIQPNEMFEHDHAYFRERTSHQVQSEFQQGHQPQRRISPSGQKSIIQMNIGYYERFYPEVLV